MGIYSPGTGAEIQSPLSAGIYLERIWKTGEYGPGAQDGTPTARGEAGYLWGLTPGSASFSEYLGAVTPPFRCWSGKAPHHSGVPGVTFRLAWTSLGQ